MIDCFFAVQSGRVVSFTHRPPYSSPPLLIYPSTDPLRQNAVFSLTATAGGCTICIQRSWICLSRKQAMAYRGQRSRDSLPRIGRSSEARLSVGDCGFEVAVHGTANKPNLVRPARGNSKSEGCPPARSRERQTNPICGEPQLAGGGRRAKRTQFGAGGPAIGDCVLGIWANGPRNGMAGTVKRSQFDPGLAPAHRSRLTSDGTRQTKPIQPGRSRETQSTKFEIRNKFEMPMIETNRSAPNEPNSTRRWPRRTGHGSRATERVNRSQFGPEGSGSSKS